MCCGVALLVHAECAQASQYNVSHTPPATHTQAYEGSSAAARLAAMETARGALMALVAVQGRGARGDRSSGQAVAAAELQLELLRTFYCSALRHIIPTTFNATKPLAVPMAAACAGFVHSAMRAAGAAGMVRMLHSGAALRPRVAHRHARIQTHCHTQPQPQKQLLTDDRLTTLLAGVAGGLPQLPFIKLQADTLTGLYKATKAAAAAGAAGTRLLDAMRAAIEAAGWGTLGAIQALGDAATTGDGTWRMYCCCTTTTTTTTLHYCYPRACRPQCSGGPAGGGAQRAGGAGCRVHHAAPRGRRIVDGGASGG